MSRQTSGFSIGPVLAIAGGALGIASLMLPWFVVNTHGLQASILGVDTSQFAKDTATQGLPVNHLQSTMQSVLAQILPTYQDKLKGSQISAPHFVLAQIIASGVGIVMGVLSLAGLLKTRPILLFAAAIAMVARPVYLIVMPIADKPMEAVGFTAHLLTPTTGLFMAVGAAVLLLASTFGLNRSMISSTAPESGTGKYGVTEPYVGGPAASNYTPGAVDAAAYGGGSGGYQGFVPGVGGGMNSSAPAAPLYGSEPARAATPPPVPGNPTGARRSSPPPPPNFG